MNQLAIGNFLSLTVQKPSVPVENTQQVWKHYTFTYFDVKLFKEHAALVDGMTITVEITEKRDLNAAKLSPHPINLSLTNE